MALGMRIGVRCCPLLQRSGKIPAFCYNIHIHFIICSCLPIGFAMAYNVMNMAQMLICLDSHLMWYVCIRSPATAAAFAVIAHRVVLAQSSPCCWDSSSWTGSFSPADPELRRETCRPNSQITGAPHACSGKLRRCRSNCRALISEQLMAVGMALPEIRHSPDPVNFAGWQQTTDSTVPTGIERSDCRALGGGLSPVWFAAISLRLHAPSTASREQVARAAPSRFIWIAAPHGLHPAPRDCRVR